MSDLFWLTNTQMARLAPFFPKSRGRARVDDRRVLSGIVFVNRNGLRWRDAPAAYGPPKTLYNCWVRWSRMGIFARMLMTLAEAGQDVSTVMIDATHLKTHRTASSLRRQKGGAVASSDAQGRPELEAACHCRREGPPGPPVPDRGPNLGLHRGAGVAVLDPVRHGFAR